MTARLSLALLEVNYLAPSLMVADACVKTANVRIIGIESTDGPQQCLKLIGETGAIMAAPSGGPSWLDAWAANARSQFCRLRWKRR